jgi:putative ABC transport system permease protein
MEPRGPTWRRYLRFWRHDLDADIADELRFHLDERTEELVRGGMPNEVARATAVAEFGSFTDVQAGLRSIDSRLERRRRSGVWRDELALDLRFALRGLRRQPVFAAIVIATLALGIGANSAIFSVVDAVLLRPLPYREPGQLVRVWSTYPPPKAIFVQMRANTRSFTGLAGYSFERDVSVLRTCASADATCAPLRATAVDVSANLFSLLGVNAALGRALREGEDRPGSDGVVVIGHALWQQTFGGDPNVVGLRLSIDGIPHTIVGVMPEDFALPSARTQLWLPATINASNGVEYWYESNLRMIGRLRAGVTLAQATSDVRAAADRARPTFPLRMPDSWGRDADVISLKRDDTGGSAPMLTVLFGAVLVVLLVCCANVANLVMARGAAREREVAIRGALGAGRRRVVRQLLTENVVLGLLGALAGLGVAYAALHGFIALLPARLPRAETIGIDGRVLVFTLVLSLATSFIFGLLPAIRASRPDLRSTLASGASRTATPHRRASEALVVVQVALAVLLVAGAGLLLKSLWLLRQVDPGFRPDHVIAVEVPLPNFPNDTVTRARDFYESVLTRLEALRPVGAGAVSTAIPFGAMTTRAAIEIEEHPTPQGRLGPTPKFAAITPGYPRTMGIPLLAGRAFTEADRDGGPPVALVDQSAARTFWPGENPLGKRLRFIWLRDWMTVVGVVGDVRRDSLTAAPEPSLYVPMQQNAVTTKAFVLLRVAGDTRIGAGLTNAVRDVVRSVNATVPLGTMRELRTIVDDSAAAPRFTSLLLAIFAAAALALGAIGIYGVVAYSVARRTREIGVRMALGARRSDVLGMVVGEGARLAGFGLAVGFVAAFAAGRLLAGLLFGVRPTDPLVLISVPMLLGVVAVGATLVPAFRASRVDPVVTMRDA